MKADSLQDIIILVHHKIYRVQTFLIGLEETFMEILPFDLSIFQQSGYEKQRQTEARPLNQDFLFFASCELDLPFLAVDFGYKMLM